MAFDTEAPPFLQECPERARGCIETQYISVIITPNLFDKQAPETQISKAMKCCEEMSSPGPHVLLLIVHPEFTEQNKHMMKIMNSWSDSTMKHTVVVLMSQIKYSTAKESAVFHSLLREEWKCYKFEEKGMCSEKELFEKIKTLDANNDRRYLNLSIYEAAQNMPSASCEQPNYESKRMETVKPKGKKESQV